MTDTDNAPAGGIPRPRLAYVVTRDGQNRAVFGSEWEAWQYLHRVTGHSVHWATTYEGWGIDIRQADGGQA